MTAPAMPFDAVDGEGSVTPDPQQFTRWAEIKEHAEGFGGDIAAAIIDLVNTGLSG
jgi:hypothetical protein